MTKCVPVLLACLLSANAARATITCEKRLPRCTSSTCNPNILHTSPYQCDQLAVFRPGSHKSPQYSSCKSSAGPNDCVICTDDIFRSPSSWDYVASTSDYDSIWFASNPAHAGQGKLTVLDAGLLNVIGITLWQNVRSIDYVDLDIAWSSYNTQSFTVDIWEPVGANGSVGAPIGAMTGNYPDGTLQYWRMYNDPISSVGGWDNNTLAGSRAYIIKNAYEITAANPGGLFIQSLTETVGYEYAGTACP